MSGLIVCLGVTLAEQASVTVAVCSSQTVRRWRSPAGCLSTRVFSVGSELENLSDVVMVKCFLFWSFPSR